MSIYWSRCDVCGKYEVVSLCHLLKLNVCPHCCITCPRRRKCMRKAWTFSK